MDIRALALLTIIALTGCDASPKQDAQPSHQPEIPDTTEGAEEPVKAVDPRQAALDTLVKDVKELEDFLFKHGIIEDGERGIVKTLFTKIESENPGDPVAFKIRALKSVKKSLEGFVIKAAEKATAPVVKTLQVRKRTFDYPEDLMDLQKVRCQGLAADTLLCKLTFKLLRDSGGVKFKLSDKDGAHLNFVTVGIPARTPVGVLTKQEIIIPRSTRRLAFIER